MRSRRPRSTPRSTISNRPGSKVCGCIFIPLRVAGSSRAPDGVWSGAPGNRAMRSGWCTARRPSCNRCPRCISRRSPPPPRICAPERARACSISTAGTARRCACGPGPVPGRSVSSSRARRCAMRPGTRRAPRFSAAPAPNVCRRSANGGRRAAASGSHMSIRRAPGSTVKWRRRSRGSFVRRASHTSPAVPARSPATCTSSRSLDTASTRSCRSTSFRRRITSRRWRSSRLAE